MSSQNQKVIKIAETENREFNLLTRQEETINDIAALRDAANVMIREGETGLFFTIQDLLFTKLETLKQTNRDLYEDHFAKSKQSREAVQ